MQTLSMMARLLDGVAMNDNGPKSTVRLRRGERAFVVIIDDENCAQIFVAGDSLEEVRDGLAWWEYTGPPIRLVDDAGWVRGWVSASICCRATTSSRPANDTSGWF